MRTRPARYVKRTVITRPRPSRSRNNAAHRRYDPRLRLSRGPNRKRPPALSQMTRRALRDWPGPSRRPIRSGALRSYGDYTILMYGARDRLQPEQLLRIAVGDALAVGGGHRDLLEERPGLRHR